MLFVVFTFMVFELKQPDKDTENETKNPRKKREEDFKIEFWAFFSLLYIL